MRSTVLRELEVKGRLTRVHVGGDGPVTLLLLHGGWGDAHVHWSRLWDELDPRMRIVAPDLPGIGDPSTRGWARLSDYVGWLESLLDALDVPSAVGVGSSFGASLAWSFGGRAPARCRGLALLDGGPMPRTPRPMAWLGRRWAGRALMRALVRGISFRPALLPRAFADPTRAPEPLRSGLSATPPRRIETFVDCLIAGDGPPAPRAPVLVVWGERDRLPGTAVARGRALAASIPGARWAPVADAGHFPQIERPDVVARAIEHFVRDACASAADVGGALL